MKSLDGTAWIGVFSVIGLLAMWAVRKGYPVVRAAVHLAELITGKPEVGKTPRVPGLGERLANIEYELKTNGGQSLRDLVAKTHKLAEVNAASVEDAKGLAASAVAKAEESASLFQQSEETAKRERLLMQESIEGLCNGLDDFAKEVHAKDMGTQRALRAAGLPISEIVDGELGL